MKLEAFDPFGDPIDGVTFVEASAGTGKTYAIEMLYLRLLVDVGLSPEQIVVVTYTNAAAAELRKRIRDRLRAANELIESTGEAGEHAWQKFVAARRGDADVRQRLLAGLFEFDRAAISTIHGFCQRVLLDHAFDSGTAFDVEMITDQTALVDEVVRDFVAAELRDTPAPLLRAVWGRDALGRMARFAARAASQPDLEIEPEPSRQEDWVPLFERWNAAFTQAVALWESEAGVIAELRGGAAIKSGSRFSAERVATAVAAALDVSALFNSTRRKELEYLTAAGVQKRAVAGQVVAHPFFDACQVLYEVEPSMEESFRPNFYHRLAAWARREIPRRKEAAGNVYFDDLLLRLHDALRGSGGERLAEKLRERFRAALIDEFQDTDPVQYEIFRRIFAAAPDRPMLLIGDPKQSIYAFRGADIHTYVEARAASDRRATLQVNRRSTDGLVAAVNELFAAPGAFALADIEFRRVEPLGSVPALGGVAGLTILRTEKGDEGVVAAGVAARIVALLEAAPAMGDVEKRLRAGDIAVLCRTNKQAADIQDQLRRRGVPSVLQGDRSVFETEEAPETMRVLRALVEPRDPSAIRAALCTSLCGVGGEEMLRIEIDEAAWQEWVERFRDWRRRWDDEGFMSAFRALQVGCRSAARLLSVDGGERRLTNYLHLGELLQVASRRQRGGPQGLLDWLALMTSDRAQRGELAAEDVQVRLESEEDAVVVTTVHKSKGLEYPVVFVPFLWQPVKLRGDDEDLPRYYERAARRIYVGESDLQKVCALALAEQLAEEMRLAYVALTRAQHACFTVITGDKKILETPIGRIAGDAGGLAAALGPDAVRVEDLGAASRRLERRDAVRAVVPPPSPPAVPGGWRVSSFSGLTRNAEGLAIEESEEGVDRDAVDEVLPLVADPEGGAEVVLAHLETGTRVGLMMHSIFEEMDFGERDAAALRALVARKVSAFRGRADRIDSLCRALEDVVRAPLAGAGGDFSLSAVAKDRRLDELEFILPVAADGGGRLTPGRLADVLARHGAPTASPAYAERVRQLDFKAFAGYLRGFIDMVFQHDGFWYVVDYKSNFLGTRWDDYAPARLAAPMSHHDYFLQYLLYVVAVDRHLARRVRGYTYERDFGGVFYLFVRGMTPARPGSGVFRDRPAAALIAELSALFDGPGGSGD